jgi:hypothetical protein
MDSTITKHLKMLSLKPKGDEFFKDVAQGLTGKSVSNPKEAKVIVRETIAKGEVDASNDNVAGLQQQVAEEKQGMGTVNPNRRLAKAYIFNRTAFDEDSAEKYMDTQNVKYGKPRLVGGNILIPLDSITKQDRLASKRIDDNISILHSV